VILVNRFWGVAECCRVLQSVAVRCNVLQCVAVCCSELGDKDLLILVNRFWGALETLNGNLAAQSLIQIHCSIDF